MSFSSSTSNVPGHIEIKLTFLNGWQLHRGPCYNCTENDEGSDVTARRKQYINDTHDPYAFGKWSLTEEFRSFETLREKNLTYEFNNRMRNVVLMVNTHERWELESSEINLLLPINISKPYRMDIMFENVMDGNVTNMGRAVPAFLQVSVDPYDRTDTKKPNRSPEVLVKPHYSLENGKTHTIHIPAVDDDDDVIECAFSRFLEAGAFNTLVKNLTNTNIIMMSKKDCVLTINLNYTRFSVGDTFALPITVKDLTRKFIVTSSVISAYGRTVGRVTVLMYFKVTGRTDPPKFIPPTPPNNQAYTLYVGVDFNVSVYAKPTDSTSRHIRKFNSMRRDGIHVQQTVKRPVLGDPNAAYISMRWSPVNSDIGKHIICVNAEDSNGVSTVEMHCFKIDVKASIFRQNPAIAGKPYFASFPNKEDRVCPIGSYCVFPVYAATENLGGIEQILRTDMSQENVTIQYSSDVINKTVGTKVAQVQFLALTPGLRQICLNATDRFDWTVRCLAVTVEKQDPCEIKPCQNNGVCTSYKDRSGFTCSCSQRHEGTLCEKVRSFCDQKPCVGTNNCIDVPSPPYFFCTPCTSGKTGIRCDVDIDLCNPTPCNENDICQQKNSTFQCQSGHSHQQCPNTCVNSEKTVCVGNQCICALKMNKNETCMSYQTNRLNTSSSNNPQFVSPSFGSVITCDTYESKCLFPVYINSESTPKLSFFKDTNNSILSGGKISILPLENSMDGFYRATTLLTKYIPVDSTYHEFDICLNVAKVSSPQVITDKRCFHVVDREVPSGRQSMSLLYPHCKFAIPTLPRDSVVGCERGQPCHFYMYAETYNGTCPNITTNNQNTGIFNPEESSGLCRYEVAYTNTSLIGKNTVCFMVCSKGESRCFQMYTNDIRDQCISNPCLNNGDCQTESSGKSRCDCPYGFWGIYCEKEINRNLTDSTENGGHFTQQNVIDTTHCYIREPCLIPISVTRNVHIMPVIEVGLVDITLEVQSIDFDPTANAGGVVSGIVKVVGHELGLKMICIDSFAQPKTSKIEDETCFKINVSLGHNLETIQSIPHFVNPTLPTSTILQCIVNQNCYVTLWTKNRFGVEKCPQLEVDKTIEEGVYIIPLRNTTHQPCVYNTVILVDNVTDFQLCFSFLHAEFFRKDRRCYIVRVLQKLRVKGSCTGRVCYNGGFCDGSLSVPRCRCPSGFSGEDCSLKLATFPPDYGQPRFIWPSPTNRTLFPCTPGQPCHVLLAVSKGYNDVNCPIIKDESRTDLPVHVLVSNFTKECRFDVRIESTSSDDQTTKMYCFKCPSDGIFAEMRCFKVFWGSIAFPSTNQEITTGPTTPTTTEKPEILSLQGRPYFLHFHQNENIVCIQNHMCNFSVYASTTFCRDIKGIENIPISEENVTISTSTKTVGMNVAKTGDVQFLPRQIGRRQICLKASDCTSFIQKCFYITVIKNNPCESSPCQHKGQCLALNAKTEFACSCRYGYTGKICETKTRPCSFSDTCVGGSTCVPVRSEPFFRCICPSGKTGVKCDVDDGYREHCDNSSICGNNAACHLVNQTVLCVCRLGYKGPTCSIEVNDHLRSPTDTGAKFTDTALPKSVICYVAFPCPIPFTVTKNIFNKPRVALGYSDPSLHVTSLELQHTAPLGGVVHGLLKVVGNSPGSASICLQSIDKSWQVRIEDEICFHVAVKNGSYFKHYSDVPHFVQPTFETDSLFECLVGDSCHFNLWAVNDIRENNCPVLKSEGIHNLNLFIMSPLNQTLSPCMYDVSLKADTPTNATTCFYLEGDAGVKYDRRCYTVQTSNLNKKGSCAGGLCYNGGHCDGHTSTKNCLCPLGFSGENCTTDHGIPQAVNQHAINNPLFGNMLVPKQVICPLKEKCNIQFLLSSRKVFNIDIKIDPSSIEIKEKEEVRVSKDFLVTLTIVHKHTGSDQLCLNLTSGNHSLVTDRFCCDIFTEETVTSNGDACVSDSVDDCKNPSALKFICSDPTTAEYCRKSCKLCDKQTKEETEQLFIPPSPTNTSAYSCSPGLECHMMLYLKRGYNNLCPEVSVIPSVGASVHVFNNSDCNVCSVDVLIKLSLSHPGQRLQQCLQATDYDFGSTERRCYFLENVQHTSP